MEKTITLTITESQLKELENVLDEVLEKFEKWEKENPIRDAQFDKNHEEFLEEIAEIKKNSKHTSKILAKWETAMMLDNKEE